MLLLHACRLRQLVAQLGKRRGRLVNISVTLEQEQVQWLESAKNMSATIRRLVSGEMARVSKEELEADKERLKALEERAEELRSFVNPLYISADYHREKGEEDESNEMFARARDLWKKINKVEAERDALDSAIYKKEQAIRAFEKKRKEPRYH